MKPKIIHLTPNLHQSVQENVQRQKNRIINRMNGQSHSGVAHFQNKQKYKLIFVEVTTYAVRM